MSFCFALYFIFSAYFAISACCDSALLIYRSKDRSCKKNSMSSSSRKYDSKGGGGSFSMNAAVAAPKGKGTTTGRAAKMEPPKEKPVSKFKDMLMHGVKPWDSDAKEFYGSLVGARRQVDAQEDRDDYY